jgi:hypothetical protein
LWPSQNHPLRRRQDVRWVSRYVHIVSQDS